MTPENYRLRPWWRDGRGYDYTLYRKGWEIGNGVHLATGNYTKSFTDLSTESPGTRADFIRTYNSMSREEGSFGVGWDFNLDVSKIVSPAPGYYQAVLPDGSNTTFHETGSGGLECLNAHSSMIKNGAGYVVTNAAQSKYYFDADGEMYKVEDAEGNQLTISALSGDRRTVTDSAGRTYQITYNGSPEHSRVTEIEDIAAGRNTIYSYDSDYRLISATNAAGGTETYEYDAEGRLVRITDCYGEVTDTISYYDNGSVDFLVNASGLRQVYTYSPAAKQTGLKEYENGNLIKTFRYDYDKKYAVKENTVETDGESYKADKIIYHTINGENRYDEIAESTDIMGNRTKYSYDTNGNIIRTTNPDGTYTLANYNSQNSVIADVDEMGYATVYAYDENGTRLLKQGSSISPLSRAETEALTASDFDPLSYLAENGSRYAVTSHEYYSDSYVSGVTGLIRKTTDPEGNVMEYDYYRAGNGKGMVSEKWVYGGGIAKPEHGIRYEYNEQQKVSRETSPEGYVREYEYDKSGHVTVTRDYGTGLDAAVTVAEYDKLGRKIAEYAPKYSADKSHGTRITYYPDGNRKTETDAEGNLTSYRYDVYGNVTETINPDGTVNLAEYDGLQREKATYFKPNAAGGRQILTSSAYEFVRNHNFDVYTGPEQPETVLCGGLKTIQKTYITAGKQVVHETLSDWRGNTVCEKTNGQTKRTSAYYANGQPACQTDALNHTTRYEYGCLNKLTKTYTPFTAENCSVTENQYDRNGNVILTKQTVQREDSDTPKYSVTSNEYNALGLLSKVTLTGTESDEKNITLYFYNHDGIETEMRTGLSSDDDTSYLKTEYVYDSRNHLIRTADSTGYHSGTITYDLNGNVLTNTDANGNRTTNTYDALNRVLKSETVADTPGKDVTKTYAYDSMGRVTESTSGGFAIEYVYDALGRKTSETETSENLTVIKNLFYAGVSAYVERETVGANQRILYSDKEYEYDDEMRLIRVRESGNEIVSYTYDANGNRESETRANGIVSSYTYNQNNKVTGILSKKGDSVISSYEYSYNLDGSDACRIRDECGIIERTEYEYDGLNRLKKESVQVGARPPDTFTYRYDDYGNRSEMTARGDQNYTTEYIYSNATGGYTALLQREVKTSQTAGAADPEEIENTYYSYDANGNQIKTVTARKTETYTYDGLNRLTGFADGETSAAYAYNAEDLRIQKTANGKTVHHIWDNDEQIIADVTEGSLYDADCYLRGTSLAASYHYRDAEKTDCLYYSQNAHGDVDNLSDSTGNVAKSYRYDAFGIEKNIDNSDTNAFRYCGEYYDTETGNVYLRARYYDSAIGRFISRDSFAGKNEDPLSLNRYTYCANNPIANFDPSGHWVNFLVGAVVGGVAGGAITAYSTWKEQGKIDWSDTLVSAGVGGLEGTVAASGYGVFAQAAMSGAVAFSGDLLSTSIDCTQNGQSVKWSNSIFHAATEGLIGAASSALGTISADSSGKFAVKFSGKIPVCSKLSDAFESAKRTGERWQSYDAMQAVVKEQKRLWGKKLRSGRHAAKDMRKALRVSDKIMAQIVEKNFYQGYSSVFGTAVGSMVSTPTNIFLNKNSVFVQR